MMMLIPKVLWLVLLVGQPQAAVRPPAPRPESRETWFEFTVKQFNKQDFDYGRWLAERKRVLLDGTIGNKYFDFCLFLGFSLLVSLCVNAKQYLDNRRRTLLAAEWVTDILNQDQESREQCRIATEKYNSHIELCNRVIEAAGSGDTETFGGTELARAREEVERLAGALANAVRDRDKAQKEVAQKSALIADMSMRLEGTKKNGDENKPSEQLPLESEAASGDLVHHINRLQQELYAERQKNKRLKGA